MKPLLAAVIAVVAATAAALGLAGAHDGNTPITSDDGVKALVVPVGSSQRIGSSQVGIKLTTVEGASLTSPTSGVVTEVPFDFGTVLSSGAVALVVDDRARIGYSAAAPLWRDVGVGMTGPDVQRAQDLLHGWGYLSTAPDGKVGLATLAAITAFNKAHGWSSAAGVLRLESLVYLGAGPFTVTEISTRPGQTVAPGGVFATGPARALAVVVTEGTAPGESAGADDVAHVLDVGDVAVPYQVGSGAITDAALVAKIATALGGLTESPARLRLETPQPVVTIPASAVITDPNGDLCVFTGPKSAPLQVKPIGGGTTTVQLPTAFTATEVLANPRDVLRNPSCS
jgi:peptidoglycan hydrolase-like protein with peptidoglycan-binding domain